MSACFFSSCVCVSFIYLFFGIPRPLVHARTSASGIEGLLMWSMSLNSASLSLDFFSLFFFFAQVLVAAVFLFFQSSCRCHTVGCARLGPFCIVCVWQEGGVPCSQVLCFRPEGSRPIGGKHSFFFSLLGGPRGASLSRCVQRSAVGTKKHLARGVCGQQPVPQVLWGTCS